MILTDFIERNFEQAHAMQKEITQDDKMVEQIQDGSIDRETVKNWMRGYGLLQGREAKIRNEIADTFIKYSQEKKTDKLLDLQTDFRELHERLRKVETRSWLSATSKLLWCMYPHEVVIYDSFVEKCVLVLQCLENELVGMDRLVRKRWPKSTLKSESKAFIESSSEYYFSYEALVKKLMEIYGPQIKELKSKMIDSYPYDIRLIDKLLWLMEYQGTKYKFSDGRFS